MRHRVVLIYAVLVASVVFLTGCESIEWVPRYMEQKKAIDSRYRSQLNRLQVQRAQGRISAATHERRTDQLYSQWDRDLTNAKARAQGRSAPRSSSGSSRPRSSGASKPSGSSGSGGAGHGGSDEGPSSSAPPDIHIPLDGGELKGGASRSTGTIE